jgi:negative regulator of sigma E activity
MMERNADKVSLLVDGELDSSEMSGVIQAMKSEAAARARWENYHLIRDALRGNLPGRIPVNLAERVSQALEHEPVFINPRLHSSSPQPHRAPSRTKATLGFALAASLSAIAVFGVGVMELNTTNRAPAEISVASVQPQQQVASATASVPQAPAPTVQLAATQEPARQPMVNVLAAAGGPAMERAAPRRSSVAVAAASPATTDLYDYLVNYNRYAPGATETQGMLSYVQLVGYGPGN